MNDELHFVPKRFWAKTVREMGGNRCAYCGTTENGTYKMRIEAHHIAPKSMYPDLENALENGIALCHNCHFLAHDGDFANNKGAYTQENPVKNFVNSRDKIVFESTPQYIAEVKAAAESAGISVNEWMKRAVREKMSRDNVPIAQVAQNGGTK